MTHSVRRAWGVLCIPFWPINTQGVIGLSEDVIRGDCSTLPGNELELIAQQVHTPNVLLRICCDECPLFSLSPRLYLTR